MYKTIGLMIGLLLVILATAFLYLGISGFISVPSASDYEDMGIHIFAPYDILPVQVENHTTGRNKRLHPTKTVYMVHYQATDGTGYKWNIEGGSTKETAQILYNQGEITRRVLSISEDDTYITIEPEQTAETYTTALRQRYILMIGGSIVYIGIYLAVWIIKKILRRKTQQA